MWPLHKRWPVRTERSASGLEHRFYLCDLPGGVDPDWLLIAGEIMFDLRSALDHLVYLLHVRRHRDRVPKSVATRTQFPIYDLRHSAGLYREPMADWRPQPA